MTKLELAIRIAEFLIGCPMDAKCGKVRELMQWNRGYLVATWEMIEKNKEGRG